VEQFFYFSSTNYSSKRSINRSSLFQLPTLTSSPSALGIVVVLL